MTESGKETMCDQIIKLMFACVFMACILCGCTRREQLLLDTERSGLSAEETAKAEQDGLTDESTADGVVPTMQHSDVPEDGGQDEAVRSVDGSMQEAANGQQTQSEDGLTICVHVCGAVESPGVYELREGSRVFEAVREAGGFTAEADDSYVNQAQQLTDGVKLVIPTVEQVKETAEGGESGLAEMGIVEGDNAVQSGGYGVNAGNNSTDGTESGPDGRININTASEAQLCEIPGIGATRAAAIVAYRQQAGGFASTEDIMKVSGIKEGTYEKIKDRITVN